MLGEWGREEGKKERRKEGDEERGRGRSRELAEGEREESRIWRGRVFGKCSWTLGAQAVS